MIKFYIPDGHLEPPVLNLFKKAGFEIKFSERAYKPLIDDKNIMLKRLRPQDFPFLLALGKGDLGICGMDILREFQLANKELSGNVVKLLNLKVGRTKLVAAVSEEMFPEIKTIEDFATYANEKKRKNEKVVVATEYFAITQDYLKKHNIDAIIRKPYGKTEGWIIPPDNEADLIVDTTETGTTLKANKCKIIDTVMESSAWLIANRNSWEKNKEKKEIINRIIVLFNSVLEVENKVKLDVEIFDPDEIEKVTKIIKFYVQNFGVYKNEEGIAHIFILIDKTDIKEIVPLIVKNSKTAKIVVSEVNMGF